MSRPRSELWARARRARDKMVDQFIDHPDVSLIGIGYAERSSAEPREIVVKIHVRDRWMKAKPEERVAFPEYVEGIRIVVVPGTYRLDTGGQREGGA